MTDALTIVLDGERAPSWNVLYAGQHWSKRKAMRDAAHLVVRAALPPDARLFDAPVDVTVTACYPRQPIDADNVSAKLYLDALKGVILRDDNPRWVRSVTTISKRAKRACVVIQLRPVEDK